MEIKIIEETAYGIQERYAIEMEALGMDKNHIHLLSSAHPKISPGEMCEYSKELLQARYSKGIRRLKKSYGVENLCFYCW